MKIVGTDNLARENIADKLFMDNISKKEIPFAERVCEALNKIFCHDHGGTFYQLKDDDYRLSRGMADLV